MSAQLAPRLRRLPVAEVLGYRVHVAAGTSARLLGLSHLGSNQVGVGLLLPGCRAVHTFGMRFRLDLVFIGRCGSPVAVRRAMPPRRFACCRAAVAVLELRAGTFSDDS